MEAGVSMSSGGASLSPREPVDPELGLTARALDETLEWARGRVDELLEDLDDDELCALLGRAVEATAPFVAEETRTTEVPAAKEEERSDTRYSLVEPAVVHVDSWGELVTLYTRDISCGGMFIQTMSPPPIDTQVAVELRLPEEAGILRFEGTVVHVVPGGVKGRPAGFGLHFTGLTAETRRRLQRMIEQAERAAAAPVGDGPSLQELGFTCAPSPRAGLRMTLTEAELEQLRELRWELAALESRGDLEVLGLGSSADLEQVRSAFERLAARWHPGMAHRNAPAEIRALVTEIFLRIEHAYQTASERLRTRRPSKMASHAPRPRRVRAPMPTPVTVAPAAEAETPREEPAPGDSSRRKRATQRLGRIVERGERLAARLRQDRPEPAAPEHTRPSRPPRPVDRALELVSQRRWAEAVPSLEQALKERPSTKLEVLLGIVRARQSAVEGDLSTARRHYESVLAKQPNHEVAQRELLMVAAMDN